MGAMLCSFVLCENVQQDRGKYSLLGIFFRVHALGYPTKKRCYIMLGWYGDEGRHFWGLKFLSPDRSRVLHEITSYPFNLTRERPYSNGVVEAELLLEEEGIYWFEVTMDGEVRGHFPLFVETVQRATHRPA